ncbi:unnamed protein product [Amoebophrya sp. A120]|nr:unnamed protein product [Amoebophrya sp. A120]|eukprot:GSA120T00003928001.1
MSTFKAALDFSQILPGTKFSASPQENWSKQQGKDGRSNMTPLTPGTTRPVKVTELFRKTAIEFSTTWLKDRKRQEVDEAEPTYFRRKRLFFAAVKSVKSGRTGGGSMDTS